MVEFEVMLWGTDSNTGEPTGDVLARNVQTIPVNQNVVDNIVILTLPEGEFVCEGDGGSCALTISANSSLVWGAGDAPESLADGVSYLSYVASTNNGSTWLDTSEMANVQMKIIGSVVLPPSPTATASSSATYSPSATPSYSTTPAATESYTNTPSVSASYSTTPSVTSSASDSPSTTAAPTEESTATSTAAPTESESALPTASASAPLPSASGTPSRPPSATPSSSRYPTTAAWLVRVPHEISGANCSALAELWSGLLPHLQADYVALAAEWAAVTLTTGVVHASLGGDADSLVCTINVTLAVSGAVNTRRARRLVVAGASNATALALQAGLAAAWSNNSVTPVDLLPSALPCMGAAALDINVPPGVTVIVAAIALDLAPTGDNAGGGGDDNNNMTMIGGIIGGAAAVVLLLICGCYCLVKKCKSKKPLHAKGDGADGHQELVSVNPMVPAGTSGGGDGARHRLVSAV